MSRPDPLADAQAETGTTLAKGGRPEYERVIDATHLDPHRLGGRAPYAWARISRICEGAQPSRNALGAGLYESACKTAQMPRLAQEFLEHWFYFKSRAKTPPLFGIDHNPYRNLSDGDAWGKFYRRVEDICDRSTGRLGSWYAGASAVGSARNRG